LPYEDIIVTKNLIGRSGTAGEGAVPEGWD